MPGFSNSTGNFNTFLGKAAEVIQLQATTPLLVFMQGNRIGQVRKILGANAGDANTTGNQKFFFGYFAGNANTTGSNNIAIGHFALKNNNGRARPKAIGDLSIVPANFNIQQGLYGNTAGHRAGFTNTSGYFNSFFGKLAGAYTTGSNNSFSEPLQAEIRIPVQKIPFSEPRQVIRIHIRNLHHLKCWVG